MVRGSAGNSVVGRAESLRGLSGGSGCRPRKHRTSNHTLGQSVIAAKSGWLQAGPTGGRNLILPDSQYMRLVASHDVGRVAGRTGGKGRQGGGKGARVDRVERVGKGEELAADGSEVSRVGGCRRDPPRRQAGGLIPGPFPVVPAHGTMPSGPSVISRA